MYVYRKWSIKCPDVQPIFHFWPPENISKPEVFWCFQGYRSGTLAENGLSIQLKLVANFNNGKRRIFVINFGRNFMLSLRNLLAWHCLLSLSFFNRRPVQRSAPQKEFHIYSKQGFFCNSKRFVTFGGPSTKIFINCLLIIKTFKWYV